MKYGFDIEEIEAIPRLIDDLQTEFALISVDRKPTFTATQQDQPKENGDPKTGGRPGAKLKAWSDLEKDIYELRQKGKTPLEIKEALIPKYPDLTGKRIKSIVDALEKRLNRKKKREKNGPK